jgi:cytochrome c5
MSLGRTFYGSLTLFAFGCLAACAAVPLGASDASVAAARQKNPQGADVWGRECANCHGQRGEGLSAAPNTMGAGALPTYARAASTTGDASLQAVSQSQNQQPPGYQSRGPLRTAEDLYAYVSHAMPKPQARAGSLKPDEYWAVVNFMLVAHGAVVPAEGVTEANAKSVSIKRP